MSPRVNQHRVSVDDRVAVLSGTRIFGWYFIVCHACIREHGTDTKFVAILVRRVMTLDDVAVKPRPIVDTQYAVHTAYDAANDTADNRSHGTGVVLTDARAVSSAIWYSLSGGSGRHCKRHGANEYDVSNHVYLSFGVKARTNAPCRREFPLLGRLIWLMIAE
jgi:hypothetical protein